jgi:hypothetical protein
MEETVNAVPEPRRVTRADAFPLAPRATAAAIQLAAPPPALDASGAAAKSFGCSVLLGFGAFAFLAAPMTCTCGTPRSVELKKEKRRTEAREEIRRALEAEGRS